MQPDHPSFAGGATDSTVSPFVLVAMILAMIAIMVLPRKFTPLPLFFITLLSPFGQQFYMLGVHFYVLRLVVLVGLIRMFISPKELNGKKIAGGINGIDIAFVICTMAQAFASIIRQAAMGAVIYQTGYLWDWLGGYFLIRWMIQDEEDVFRTLKYLAVLMIPLAIGMMMEQTKLFNYFSVFGGVPAVPEIREGKIRSQASFEHCLMAGCFAAVLPPLFLMLWKEGKAKLLGGLGILTATVMMLTSNSSTPLLAYAAGIGGIFAWQLRKSMRKVRWGIVFALLVLNAVMKAPIWFLIAHIDLTGSSSSYHRAALVDAFIRHFTDWWLIGTSSNADWGWDMWDVQNQYVSIGESGGLLALVFFILVISRTYGRLGNARKLIDGDLHKEWILWFLGCALFAETVGFFGVNLFDQSHMGWFLLIAMVCAVTSPILAGNSTAPVNTSDKIKDWLPKRRHIASENPESETPEVPAGRLVPKLRRV
jgi:hypothetical protein